MRAAERSDPQRHRVAAAILSSPHPMTTAAANAHLVEVAGGAQRVTVAFGSGFTARLTMGRIPTGRLPPPARPAR